MKTVVNAAARWGAAIGLIVLLVLAGAKNKLSNADFGEVSEAVTGSADLTAVVLSDERHVRRYYGLDAADFEGLVLYAPASNMDAEELLLVKLRDPAQAESVKAAAERRIEAQKKSFDGYGVEQYALLTDHCVLEVRGNWVLFVVHPDAASIRRAFLQAL